MWQFAKCYKERYFRCEDGFWREADDVLFYLVKERAKQLREDIEKNRRKEYSRSNKKGSKKSLKNNDWKK